MDYNQAGAQRSFDVIPDGTIVIVQMNLRSGHAGEDGLLKRSRNGQAEGLDAEFTVVEGEYAKRKLWSFMVISGTTDGHEQAADITRRRLRAILESARGIKPEDVSEAAKAARVAEFADFDGIRFMAKLGVEPACDGYPAKNILAEVITPDRKEWRAVEQQPKTAKAKKAPTMHRRPLPSRRGRHDGEAKTSPSVAQRGRRHLAARGNSRCHREGPCRCSRRHGASYDADRAAVRHRVGMDRCGRPVRLD
jgi:hypothetical protein